MRVNCAGRRFRFCYWLNLQILNSRIVSLFLVPVIIITFILFALFLANQREFFCALFSVPSSNVHPFSFCAVAMAKPTSQVIVMQREVHQGAEEEPAPELTQEGERLELLRGQYIRKDSFCCTFCAFHTRLCCMTCVYCYSLAIVGRQSLFSSWQSCTN